MPENASVFQRAQLAVESVAGVAPATDYRRLLSLSVEPSPAIDVKPFRGLGYKYPSLASLGKEWSKAKVNGQPTYNEIIYPLASVVGTPTITTLGATTARKWTFAPNTSDTDTPKTFTVESGSSVRANRFSNGIFSAFSLSVTREEFTISGEMIGQKFLDGKHRWLQIVATGGTFTFTVGANTTSALAYNVNAGALQTALEGLASVGVGNVLVTGGPGGSGTTPFLIQFTGTFETAEPGATSVNGASLTGGGAAATLSNLEPNAASPGALVPILPTQVQFKVADAQSGLGAAAVLDRIISCEWSIGDRFSPVWPVNSAVTSYAAVVETVPSLEAKIKLAVDSNGMSFLNYARNGATRFLRLKATGGLADTGYYYDLQLDTALKVTDVSEFSDEDGLYAVEFTMGGVHDATWGRAFQFDVQNLVAAL